MQSFFISETVDSVMRVLAVLEGNLVVVEPRLETILRHANVLLRHRGAVVTVALYTMLFARAIERATRSFFLQFHCLSDAELASTFPRIFALWLLIILAMLLIQL